MKILPAMLLLASLVPSEEAQEALRVDTKGVTASILYEAPITGVILPS